MGKKKRIDPIIAKAIKKQAIAIERMNYVGAYRIHSVVGKGKKKVTIIAKHEMTAKEKAQWVRKYNVHLYVASTPVISDAVGQAQIMKKNVVYIDHEL